MRLHINVDHVATLRNARGTPYPDPVEAARVCLEADPKNKANGFKWSSSTGPNRPITGGGQCSASLLVDTRRPYTYVIPAVRRTVGI